MKLFFVYFLFVTTFLFSSASFVEFSWGLDHHQVRGLSWGEHSWDDDDEVPKYDDLDPFYPASWHLHSMATLDSSPYAQVDVHVNVEGVWKMGFQGHGIRIATSFIAPNPNHRDLVGHLEPVVTISKPSEVATSIIGTVVGTAFNDACTRGVAYEASYSVVSVGIEDAMDLKFLTMDSPDIFLQTFNAESGQTPCEYCWENVKGVYDRGLVVVAFTGNGGRQDNCNYDMYSNHPFSISVGSHMFGGFPSDFGEPCANALISAPGGSSLKGIPAPYKSDKSCSERIGGQYSAAIVAGVVALMLEASARRPGPREIAHILVETSKFPDQFPGLQTN
eukprot:CAMPEP_0201493196 /NCGR_PEP_ID=MMETSP0151_2-20130828/36270_1 /ASSEMBLY_ACC=CAM_ASM_000257 /TAXON_ID=200890 /ORGANISM="Paramoeba atlantica, Strain 621/1 / CCAP 1560/9" /LENGTH=333 /DNA_ID=CAMNT_0047880399 /DNA_START=66 /DNA_END=1064 /DNA_ORIENTATION=-